jgi:hypothetical protein
VSAGAALLFSGSALVAPPLAYVAGAYSAIERRLDAAQVHLIQAASHTCRDARAKRAFQPVGQRFEDATARARQQFGRELNLSIWTYSCRSAGDGPRFRSALRSATAAIRRAEELIHRGNGDQWTS